MYLKNFKHIVKHKWYILLECWSVGLYWHGITHDISKFFPSEFVGYSENFFGDKLDLALKARIRFGVYCNEELPIGWLPEDRFAVAWLLHQHRNKHHWDYWVKSDNKPVPMPIRYVKQMVCDWRAMSRQFGGTAHQFYQEKQDGIILHTQTKKAISEQLDVRR